MYNQAMYENDINAFIKKEKEIDDRISKMVSVPDDLVLVRRYDQKLFETFLSIDPKADKDRIRTSWYGRILLISPSNCDNIEFENRKKLVNQNDIIIYNPDTAYSLNLKDFPEIWVISILNILIIDAEYNPLELYKSILKRKIDIYNK